MNYPKIGIRPTIDGRQGGIREGLETQTMTMALKAKELIEANLRYPRLNTRSVRNQRYDHRRRRRSGSLRRAVCG